ncbi:hypothetical protein [Chelatococcus asaccharovorans]|uniref:Uncharacterized protein n=1 Tax=Chelatococcus asaccharovorans TaxID=28210 RepID=A0A2V3TRT5_9HYPH|nr:hypothetical protein [Chelatococcus asaccharovorans]MBS7702661.1 hypothetical protein [Chelatococcus asaccharovorans]PXW50198.1 hypothetical protein C7450_13010 [Chelatococcus asaccharovorans]
MNDRRIQKVGFVLATALLWAGVFMSGLLPLGAGYAYVVILALIALFTLGERGAYPFVGKHGVKHRLAFWLYALAVLAYATLARNHSALFWYPTDSPRWINAIPIVYGVAALARGWHIILRGRGEGLLGAFLRAMPGNIVRFPEVEAKQDRA